MLVLELLVLVLVLVMAAVAVAVVVLMLGLVVPAVAVMFYSRTFLVVAFRDRHFLALCNKYGRYAYGIFALFALASVQQRFLL